MTLKKERRAGGMRKVKKRQVERKRQFKASSDRGEWGEREGHSLKLPQREESRERERERQLKVTSERRVERERDSLKLP